MNLNEFHNELLNSKEYVDAVNELKLHFDLANSVLIARINKGWSQKELAEKIGTKQANISRIEAGLANPTLNLIQKLASVLDINVSFSCVTKVGTEFHFSPQLTKTVSADYRQTWSNDTVSLNLYGIDLNSTPSKVFEYA